MRPFWHAVFAHNRITAKLICVIECLHRLRDRLLGGLEKCYGSLAGPFAVPQPVAGLPYGQVVRGSVYLVLVGLSVARPYSTCIVQGTAKYAQFEAPIVPYSRIRSGNEEDRRYRFASECTV